MTTTVGRPVPCAILTKDRSSASCSCRSPVSNVASCSAAVPNGAAKRRARPLFATGAARASREPADGSSAQGSSAATSSAMHIVGGRQPPLMSVVGASGTA